MRDDWVMHTTPLPLLHELRFRRLPERWSSPRIRRTLALLAFVVTTALFPGRFAGRDAAGYFDGDIDQQSALAEGCKEWLGSGKLTRGRFGTASGRFDGEWMFATYMMAGMGFAQMAEEHPENADEYRPLVEAAVDQILTPASKAFEVEAWGSDPIAALDTDHGHAAYLGYLDLLLSLERRVWPNNKHAALNDRITASLVRRLDRAPLGLVESYHGEIYPIDNTALFGAIGLYDRATHEDHSRVLAKVFAALDAKYTDPFSGMLYQRVAPGTGEPVDAARASGTSLAAYFMSFADEGRAKELDRAVARNTDVHGGFGLVREYPRGANGVGDIDSGPVLLGYGVTATGFSLSGARIAKDESRFRALYATAHLFGAPRDGGGVRHFTSGGPVGDAIMFAMLTAHGGRS